MQQVGEFVEHHQPTLTRLVEAERQPQRLRPVVESQQCRQPERFGDTMPEALQRRPSCLLQGQTIDPTPRRDQPPEQEALALTSAAVHHAELESALTGRDERREVAPFALPVEQIIRTVHVSY
ncbi:MAG: hypothetical protein ACRDSL_20860 [Pseudonocardiaceae bacterium]